jgi:hypothetical protein
LAPTKIFKLDISIIPGAAYNTTQIKALLYSKCFYQIYFSKIRQSGLAFYAKALGQYRSFLFTQAGQ